MATGYRSWSSTAATNASADSNIGWAEGQAPSSVNDSARYMMKVLADYFAATGYGVITNATVGGTASAITLTGTAGTTTTGRAAGQSYLFSFGSSVTGDTTLTVDTQTSGHIYYRGQALISGDYASGDKVLVLDDGTNYQIIGLPPRLSAGVTDWPTDTTGGDVADLLILADANQSNAINKTTVQKVLDNALTSLTADTTPDVADSLMTYDASATATKTTTVTNFYKTINTLTADATGATGDKIPTYDVSASGAKYILISTLQALLTAAQSDQETGTSTALFVTSGRQHFHDSAAKAWTTGVYSAGAPVSPGTDSYNVSSVSDTTTGTFTVNFTTSFSSANYVQTALAQRSSSNSALWPAIRVSTDPTASACAIACSTDGASLSDPVFYSAIFHGDL